MLSTIQQIWAKLSSRWQKPRIQPAPGSYTIFTTDYDETIDAPDLPRILTPLNATETKSFEEAVRRFDHEFTAERVTIAASAGRLVGDLLATMTPEQRSGTVVSFLIDHSGSMRGQRMLAALLAVENAHDTLSQAGIASEVLGFTTASWKGGRARRRWIRRGSFRNPGRLCDLRHIVYSSADNPVLNRWHLRQALRPDLLHENIDGEALQWAAGRLDPVRWSRRVLCVLSDGAPVDDSTLLANDDPDILLNHLKMTEEQLQRRGMIVGFLVIGDEKYRGDALHERASTPETAALSLLTLIRRTLLEPPGHCDALAQSTAAPPS